MNATPTQLAAPASPATAPGGRRARAGRELPVYALAAALSSIFAALALRLWRADLDVPFYYRGDALAVGAHFKTVFETGWYENQPALGAPFGQTYHDFPTADNLHMAAAAVLDLILESWAAAMNVYYLLGFPLAAVTAVWFFRLAGVSRAMSVVLAVLFSLAPYHFERNEAHLWLASYYPVPLAAGVVLLALRGAPLWGSRRSSSRRVVAWGTGPAAITVLAMVLLGSASTYYSVFLAVLLGVAGSVALWRDRNWRRFLGAAAAGAVLVVTMLANMLPDLLYARGREPNTLALTRPAGEAEVYALKLAQLLLPSDRHRFDAFQDLRRRYNETFPVPGESPSLGLVAAVGLVVLLLVAAAALASRRRAAEGPATTMRHLSLLTLTALAAAGIGGVSTMIALFLTPNLRGWNRMSIVLACFCLAAVGLLLDRLLRHVRRRGAPPGALATALPAVVAVGVLGVGVVDQTSGAYVPEYGAVADAYASDEAYVDAIEEALPAGAAVYQLPHRAFPETAPVNGVLDSDQLRPYLHSTEIRWSGGALKGRPRADWPLALADEPISTVIPLLALAGFSGISVDRAALGQEAADVEAELAAELGSRQTATSPDGRFAFWPIEGVVEQLRSSYEASELEAAREALLLPPVAYLKPDFADPATLDDGSTLWRSLSAAPQILLDNPRDTPVDVRLSFGIASPTGAAGVQVRLPGEEPMALDLTGGPAQVDAALTLPPGRSVVQLSPPPQVQAAVPEPERVRFDVLDTQLTDPVLEGFEP